MKNCKAAAISANHVDSHRVSRSVPHELRPEIPKNFPGNELLDICLVVRKAVLHGKGQKRSENACHTCFGSVAIPAQDEHEKHFQRCHL